MDRELENNAGRKGDGVAVAPALAVFCFCLFAGVAAVGYLYQKNQLETLGREIRYKEIHLEDLKAENEKLADLLTRYQTPRYLDMAVKRERLGLVEPREEQILRLEETQHSEPAQISERRWVRRRSAAGVN